MSRRSRPSEPQGGEDTLRDRWRASRRRYKNELSFRDRVVSVYVPFGVPLLVALLAMAGYLGKRVIESDDSPDPPEEQFVVRAGPASARPKVDVSPFRGLKYEEIPIQRALAQGLVVPSFASPDESEPLRPVDLEDIGEEVYVGCTTTVGTSQKFRFGRMDDFFHEGRWILMSDLALKRGREPPEDIEEC